MGLNMMLPTIHGAELLEKTKKPPMKVWENALQEILLAQLWAKFQSERFILVQSCLLLLEYMEQGALFDFLHQNEFNSNQNLMWARQVAAGKYTCEQGHIDRNSIIMPLM